MEENILKDYQNALRIAKEQNVKLRNELEWYKNRHIEIYYTINRIKACIRDKYEKCKAEKEYGKCYGLKTALFILEKNILIERKK